MKKSLFTVSALMLAFAVTFTACGKKDIVFKDNNGNTHVAVTDKKGNYIQNEYGYLMEEVTDEDGKTVTKPVAFPEVMTNKANTSAENAILKIKLPHGWRNSGLTSKMTIWHSGECTKSGSPKCEITFSYDLQSDTETLYKKYLKEIQYIINSGAGEKLNVYEKEVLGHKAKTVFYKLPDADVSCYCFFIQNGAFAIRIEAYTTEKCYTEDQLIEMLNSSCTLKELGGEELTTETTASTTAPAQEASSSAKISK
ncbi:MAG: hypothetical protein MJ168_11280 [Clostridia bacterium]|nr:hypothetical protein [Clostridia bacterium]